MSRLPPRGNPGSKKKVHNVLRHANTINESELKNDDLSTATVDVQVIPVEVSGCIDDSVIDMNNNPNKLRHTESVANISDEIIFPRHFAWDWPFSNDGIARGVYTKEKFSVSLPFHSGYRVESMAKKFGKLQNSNYSWTVGLSTVDASFWRMEIELIKSLNMVAVIIFRDISVFDNGPKRLKRIRKVYRLPNIYDINTVQSTAQSADIIIEAFRKRDVKTNRPIPIKTTDIF